MTSLSIVALLLNRSTYEEWKLSFDDASNALGMARRDKLMEVAEEIEREPVNFLNSWRHSTTMNDVTRLHTLTRRRSMANVCARALTFGSVDRPSSQNEWRAKREAENART